MSPDRLFLRHRPDPHGGPPSSDPGLRGWRRGAVLAAATGLGAGYAPVASGTFGGAVGMALYLALAPWMTPWAYALAVLLLTAAAIPVATAAEGILGRKDDGRVVLDEVVGSLVTMIGAWGYIAGQPLGRQAAVLAVGFVLARLFDIVKPWPAHRLQALPGGWGIVADDFVAGLYSCVALHAVLAWVL